MRPKAGYPKKRAGRSARRHPHLLSLSEVKTRQVVQLSGRAEVVSSTSFHSLPLGAMLGSIFLWEPQVDLFFAAFSSSKDSWGANGTHSSASLGRGLVPTTSLPLTLRNGRLEVVFSEARNVSLLVGFEGQPKGRPQFFWGPQRKTDPP